MKHNRAIFKHNKKKIIIIVIIITIITIIETFLMRKFHEMFKCADKIKNGIKRLKS